MKKRLDALTRIGRLQARLRDLGRWRLTAIEQEQATLADDLRAAFEAIESGDLAYGAQAKLGARRIRALQERLDSLSGESDDVRRKAQAHAIRAKLAERAAETAAETYRDRKERKELADLVERAIALRHASQT